MPKIEIKTIPKTSHVISDSNTSYIDNISETVEIKPKTKYEAKVEARYYLPVLNLNNEEYWPTKQLSERKHFTSEVAKSTCLGNCCGHEGLRAGCCQLDPEDLEHVLGPVDEKWIKDILKYFNKKGINYKRQDIVVDHEEGLLIGKAFFNDHPIFHHKDSYPFLRIQVNGIRFSCKFLNVNTGMCTIYENRPPMCQNYLCSYVKSNFLVQIPNSGTKKYVKLK